MKLRMFCLLLLINLAMPFTVLTQTNDLEKVESVFGRPFRTMCVVTGGGFASSCKSYNFDKDFAVGASFDDSSNVLVLDLAAKGYPDEMDDPLSERRKLDFLEKVAKIRPLGAFRFKGDSNVPSTTGTRGWEIYENAMVRMVKQKMGSDGYELSQITVLFPTKIKGIASSIEKEDVGTDYISRVSIDGCTYWSPEKSLKLGIQRTFWVVGPMSSCANQLKPEK